jgi:hypothetical protein
MSLWFIIQWSLQLPPFSESDVLKATKRLRPYKSVEIGSITGFITKGSSAIFAPKLKYIFDLSLSHFQTQWKKNPIILSILKMVTILL